jgi:glycosyltransferase involved in cell wall biosynthesis
MAKHKKLKVLLCSLYGRSGMLQYASQLANALSKNINVFVLIPDYSDTSLFDKKVNLIRVKAPPNVMKTAMLTVNPIHISRIIRKMKEANPDIIHFLDNHPWYLLFLPHFKNKKLFVTQHDVIPHKGENIRGKITILVNKALNRKAQKIIVHGEKLKKELSDSMPEQKIIIFPHGDYSFFLRWKKKNVKEEQGTLLFFGRILHYKGLDILLKALEKVRKQVCFKLIIAGEGDLNPYQELITKELKPSIEIINRYIPENEVPEYFQRASIIVLPYREASQSGVIPIAYAFKKAVICTNVGSLPEVIDNNRTGILIEPENPELLAKSIVCLLNDKRKRKKLGQAGYLKMKKELSWDSIASRLVKQYEQAS